MTPTPTAPVLSVSPVALSAPGRAAELQIRVSAPLTGAALPVLLLSHGHGPSNHLSSLHGYAPLADYYAAHGFVVLQPTHLDSRTLDLTPDDDHDAPLFWRSRAQDMTRILDQLDTVEAAVPGLQGRLDRTRVAAVGHSMGGHTVSLLLGAGIDDPVDGTPVDLTEPRISVGALLAAPGSGSGLSTSAAADYPDFFPDFASITAPVVVVVGDEDDSPHFTVRGPDWHADPYRLSSGPAALLTLFGAGHGLGGVSGYDAAETTDEDPARVDAVRAVTLAYVRSVLYAGDPAWSDARAALAARTDPLGRVESRDVAAPVGQVA